MTIYVMEARENYADPILSVLMTDDQPSFCSTQQFIPSVSFDAVRGNILYSCCSGQSFSSEVNPKSVALWSGQLLIDVSDTYEPKFTPVQNAATHEGYFVCEKNVSTDAVTFNDTFDATSLVPNGIGGSDGTYQRFVEADRHYDQNLPKMVDPWTGNLLAHHVMAGDNGCACYYFERVGGFKHQISPVFSDQVLFPDGAHMEPLGVTNDWWYIEQQDTDDYVGLSPRVVTADEIADDYKQLYASFAHALPADANYARHCFDADGNLYAFGRNIAGTKAYELHKLTPPSSAPYGGPVVGGGFSDVTPWMAGAGPDSTASAYDLDGSYLGGKNLNKQFPYYLPETDAFALFTVLLPADKTGGTQADFKISCTYVDLAGPSSDHHAAFVTGYMDAAWASTVLGSAAYAVLGVRESNRYRDTTSYTHTDDYTKRWFCFVCHPVAAGVVDTGQVHFVFVQYELVSGAAPAVLTVIDEQGWDDAYAAYGVTISDTNVVAGSGSNDSNSAIYLDDFIALDGPVFWFSGQDNTANSNTFHLNGFDARADFGGMVTPFLRLAATEPSERRRMAFASSYVAPPAG